MKLCLFNCHQPHPARSKLGTPAEGLLAPLLQPGLEKGQSAHLHSSRSQKRCLFGLMRRGNDLSGCRESTRTLLCAVAIEDPSPALLSKWNCLSLCHLLPYGFRPLQCSPKPVLSQGRRSSLQSKADYPFQESLLNEYF